MRFSLRGQSKSFTEKRQRRRSVGFIFGVLAVVSWLYVFSRISFMPAFEITTIEIYGAPEDLLPSMNAAAQDAIDGTYWGIFSKANSLIYPGGEISRSVASASPIVDNITVTRTSLNSVVISVSERTPEAIVCADLPDLAGTAFDQSENCYVSDGAGMIFRHLQASDPKSFNQFYLPELSGKNLPGTYATTTAKFKTLQSLVKEIKSAGINVRATLMKGGQDYELYADNPSGSSIVVIQMNDRADLNVEKDNLIAFWSKMTGDARTKGVPLAWSEIKLQYPPNVYSRQISAGESR